MCWSLSGNRKIAEPNLICWTCYDTCVNDVCGVIHDIVGWQVSCMVPCNGMLVYVLEDEGKKKMLTPNVKVHFTPIFELNVPIVDILPGQGDNGECQVGY